MRLPLLSRLALLTALVLIVASCAGPVGSAGPTPSTTAVPLIAADTARPAPITPSLPTSYPAPSLPTSYPAPSLPTSYPAPALEQAPPTPTSVPVPPVSQPAQTGPEYLRCTVASSHSHDPIAWTQGLIYIGNDSFYESTGLYEQSRLREVGLDGAVRREVLLNTIAPAQPALFGEGIALVGDQIFQITWQNGRGFIYNQADFQLVDEFSYPPAGGLPAQGWGLTYDGQRLIMSDGSSTLYFVDPAATASTGVLAVTGQVQVLDRGQPIGNLNELEYINGEVWANVWLTDWIIRIDPASGQVKAWIDCSGLLSESDRQADPMPDVLNGIAYDAATDRLFVTGKRWPKLFEIDLALPQSFIVNVPLLGL